MMKLPVFVLPVEQIKTFSKNDIIFLMTHLGDGEVSSVADWENGAHRTWFSAGELIMFGGIASAAVVQW